MTKSLKLVVGTVVLLLALALGATLISAADVGAIEMVVSPNTLNLGSQGGSLSVHTDLDYDAVDGVSMTVNDELPEPGVLWCFADDRGDLVVKCDLATIKEMVRGFDVATFVLTVDTSKGPYEGSDAIPVIDRGK